MKFNIFKSETDLTEARAQIDGLVKSLATKETELTEAQKLAEGLADSNRELGKEIEQLKEQVKTAKESANRQAAETLASLGVPEGTVKPETASAELSAEEFHAKLNELQSTNPAAATQFYRQHGAKFFKTNN
jgi:chromosome segregation ATPase